MPGDGDWPEDARNAEYLSAAATTLGLCGGILVSTTVLVARVIEIW